MALPRDDSWHLRRRPRFGTSHLDGERRGARQGAAALPAARRRAAEARAPRRLLL